MDLQNNSNAAKLLDRDGKIIGRQGETLGVGVDAPGRSSRPLKLKQGAWAARRRARSCSTPAPRAKQHFKVGDTIARRRQRARARRTRSPASPRYGSVDSLGGASIAVFDLPTAQALFDKAGALRQHLGQGRQGRRLAGRAGQARSSRCCPRRAEVKTGDAQAKADAKDINESLKFITYFLLGFGGIALFVGAFVILNTLSITVAQRSREFATLRTLGASRRQVLRSVVLEGARRRPARLGDRARRSGSASPRA